MIMSKYFSKRALISFNTFGDLLMPATDVLPAFSETGCLEHIDDLAVHAPQDDIGSLNLVLVILSFMPTALFRWLIKKMIGAQQSNSMLSTVYRQLNFGIKGLLYSLYYSGKSGLNYKGEPVNVLIGNDAVRLKN
jgi:hypothetical protein